ncbi:MAG: hypothetical protein IPN67_15710 [Bacteroidales bacterium]|nr:hypothetical protein [Bacteroidales bacterium]
MRKAIFLLTFLGIMSSAFSGGIDTKSDSLRKDALLVYMEANDYIRKEIPYVNYVRDIKDASVYVLSTRQRTGAGGTEFTYFLVGQNENNGMYDTLSFISAPDATYDEIRLQEVNTLKLGLMRYIAKTPLAKYIQISFSEPISQTVSSDKWDSWVFKGQLSGWFNGQQTYTSNNLYGSFSANRVTEEWKINLRARYSYGIERFVIDEETIRSNTNSKSLSGLVVKSISDHWSYGGSAYIGSSIYNNLDRSIALMPGIEYDIFPYSQSTRKQLRILYSVGYNYFNYIDTTVYFKTEEGHAQHSINVAYAVVQKWGTIDLSSEYSNYLYDWSKNNISLYTNFSLRVLKGLQLNFSGGASILHDQLGLAKTGATTEEILLQKKELATQFQYWGSFGVSYTFGSIYNNVVNPRFGNQFGWGH